MKKIILIFLFLILNISADTTKTLLIKMSLAQEQKDNYYLEVNNGNVINIVKTKNTLIEKMDSATGIQTLKIEKDSNNSGGNYIYKGEVYIVPPASLTTYVTVYATAQVNDTTEIILK